MGEAGEAGAMRCDVWPQVHGLCSVRPVPAGHPPRRGARSHPKRSRSAVYATGTSRALGAPTRAYAPADGAR